MCGDRYICDDCGHSSLQDAEEPPECPECGATMTFDPPDEG